MSVKLLAEGNNGSTMIGFEPMLISILRLLVDMLTTLLLYILLYIVYTRDKMDNKILTVIINRELVT
jgi:hypothetical protein